MLVGGRFIRLVICVATGTLWLVGCGKSPTPPGGAATATIAEETQTVPATAEGLPRTTKLPTPTTTAIATETPSRSPTPTATPVPPTEVPYYEDRTGAVSLLASYYNAINRQEYSRAWAYWESPPVPSFEDFVQRFADTVSVLLTVRPPTWFEGAAGSTYTSIPALLSATHLDGSRHNSVECFVARRPNVGGPGVEQEWSLFDATLDSAPDNSADARLLAGACEPVPETMYDDQTSPVHLLASYYNAINRGEYSRAWEYWETPPDPSFEDFAKGFADTRSVMLVVRPPTRSEGAAGSVYVAIPALLSATHTDGSRHNFVGCFVARRPNVGGPGVEEKWWLFDATVRRTAGNATDVTMLDRVCTAR